jgi:hypothetical protein
MSILQPSQMPMMRPLPMQDGELRRWLILEDWIWINPNDRFESYGVKKGFIFDGASIPRLFRNILSPTGYLFLAGLIHDHLYQHKFVWTLPVYEGGQGKYWFKHSIDTKDQADEIFRSVANTMSPGNKCLTGISKFALWIGGGFAWNECREKELCS